MLLGIKEFKELSPFLESTEIDGDTYFNLINLDKATEEDIKKLKSYEQHSFECYGYHQIINYKLLK